VVCCIPLSHPVFASLQAENPEEQKEEPVPVFKVHAISGFNSTGLDFSPVVIDDKLVFVSERDIDLVNYGETGYNKQSYLTIQYSTITTKDDTTTYSVPRLFSGRISQLQHSGPISFNKQGNFAVFTRVQFFKNGTERVYRPQLFSTQFEKNKWRNIEMLNINNSQYSFGHPTLSMDGKKLYFVSDMEGGYGGKDIYYTEYMDSVWSDPINLGPAVNTVGNEAFPFLYKDSLFFFSSDGHLGFGGLDLHYSKLENGQITEVIHLDSSINSAADDFGFFLLQGQNTGYFSSNRNLEMKDDIYGFSLKWIKPSQMPKTIAGVFKFRNLENELADSLNVYLVDNLGQIIHMEQTDEYGNFEFTNLPYNHEYVIRTDAINTDLVMILLDDKGKIIAELAVNDKGEFLYKKLSYKEIGGLQFLYTSDSTGLVEGQATKSLSGQLDYKQLPYKTGKGMKILLINEAGDILFTTIADSDGNFEFTNLPYDANYIVMTEEYDPDLTLIIFNEGKVVAELSSNLSGKFMYVKLPHSAATTLALMDISEGDNFLFFRGYESDNWLKEENNVAVASADNQTAYVFHTLDLKNQGALTSIGGSTTGFCPDTYDLTMEELDECIELTIEDLLGEIAELSTTEVEPKLNTGMETIYFDRNSSYFTRKDSLLLDKVFEILNSENSLRLEANGYTDEIGEDHYNVWISERRARRIADYIIGRGISATRITVKGWGAARRVSGCKECTEEQLRVDRRTELKIY